MHTKNIPSGTTSIYGTQACFGPGPGGGPRQGGDPGPARTRAWRGFGPGGEPGPAGTQVILQAQGVNMEPIENIIEMYIDLYAFVLIYMDTYADIFR